MNEVMRALATEVLFGNLSDDLTPAELVDHVEKTGGLSVWASEVKKHPLIE